jgi:Ser/Thr protein kinase RdoA (MazF antagonist)
MCTPTQLGQNLFRILLYRNDATELLIEGDSQGLRLPAVRVPAHTRAAEEINAAIKNIWNLETYCLFALSSDDPLHSRIRCHVVEVCRPEANIPAGTKWLKVVSLSVRSFEDSADFSAIQKSLATLNQYRRGELPGTFGKPGWLRTVTEWVETEAAAVGLCLTGELRQFNASPDFSLIRFATDGPALWFKAVGHPNQREYPITITLANLFPIYVPRVVATRSDWNAWLATEVEGTHPDNNSTFEAWTIVTTALATLQIASSGRLLHLLHAGCREATVSALYALIDPFLDFATQLMEQQTKLSPRPLSRDDLFLLGEEIKFSLHRLEACNLPNVLGHLDFNSGNILVSSEHCVFLDWAEACVGPPVLTFAYLMDCFDRMGSHDGHQQKQIISDFVKAWKVLVSPALLVSALEVAPLLGLFAYIAGSDVQRSQGRLQNPRTMEYLRSLLRRMKRAADDRPKRRISCPV